MCCLFSSWSHGSARVRPLRNRFQWPPISTRINSNICAVFLPRLLLFRHPGLLQIFQTCSSCSRWAAPQISPWLALSSPFILCQNTIFIHPRPLSTLFFFHSSYLLIAYIMIYLFFYCLSLLTSSSMKARISVCLVNCWIPSVQGLTWSSGCLVNVWLNEWMNEWMNGESP